MPTSELESEKAPLPRVTAAGGGGELLLPQSRGERQLQRQRQHYRQHGLDAVSSATRQDLDFLKSMENGWIVTFCYSNKTFVLDRTESFC